MDFRKNTEANRFLQRSRSGYTFHTSFSSLDTTDLSDQEIKALKAQKKAEQRANLKSALKKALAAELTQVESHISQKTSRLQIAKQHVSSFKDKIDLGLKGKAIDALTSRMGRTKEIPVKEDVGSAVSSIGLKTFGLF
ncbi:hypothetical protein [Bacillus haynesii]|uniref:hypothetical protein n=1 Tax=Bacillus haynesii TaxID=1925021 RepID=UPI00228147C9|nr:hypothetical protein [Bacillus haynesii]MCY8048564.1 hypothetical protein [Bacillus haynesii]MCY8081415.1 hypothetical protein [Bacillus haynesii]MCY8385306.1 hypothetical protein [Bacillus haynesii]MCY8590906.1 hypothetical protein [Bacillus haynesii]MCY9217192.1 hypothetical protein [Bacillus haynesii]